MTDTKPRREVDGLPARLAMARAALSWERLWRSLWLPTSVLGLFLAAALGDVLPALPGWLHVLFLFVLGVGFIAAIIYGLRRFALPADDDVIRRVERDSGLAHRPLAGLHDTLAGGKGDRAAEALWHAHRRRLLTQVARLRVALPAPGVAARDPFAVRALIALLLVLGVVAAGTDAGPRLARAVTPTFGGPGSGLPPVADVWVTPPTYTGLAPRFLNADTPPETIIEVPEGSTVLAQVHGGSGQPSLAMGEHVTPFESVGKDSYRIEGDVVDGDRLQILQDGEAVVSWPLRVIGDAEPTIAFLRPPAGAARNALQLDYETWDDYGIETLMAEIQRSGSAVEGDPDSVPIGDEVLTLDLPLTQAGPGTATARSYHDLTSHIWAGLPVLVQLKVRDAKGQIGASESIPVVLPERIFQHPVARRLVEERKRLTLNPEERDDVAAVLEEIVRLPKRYYDDIVVFLGLRLAQRRLLREDGEESLSDVQQLMWDLALRIEDGNLSLAERDLRDAQEALEEALRRGADDAEIERLMDELEQALQRFMQALAEEMQRNPERFQQGAVDPDAMVLDGRDLQEMLDNIREMARSGARDAARQMLSQLRDMLENLQGMAGRPQQSDHPAAQMLEELQDIINNQQRLLDQTFRQSQQMPGQNEGEDGQAMQGGAADQEALRRQLGELMRRLGEMTGQIPGSLGNAEQEMRGAVDALNRGSPGDAVGPQSRALDQLVQGGRDAADQLLEQFGGQAGLNPQQGGRQPGDREDPLGRPLNGMGNVDTSDIEIPSQPDLQRARQILDELHRRASERSRPRFELDYIDRLLRRF